MAYRRAAAALLLALSAASFPELTRDGTVIKNAKVGDVCSHDSKWSRAVRGRRLTRCHAVAANSPTHAGTSRSRRL